MKTARLGLLSILLLGSASFAATPPQQPVPPDPATVTASPGRSPAVTYLMQAHRISEAEARERIDAQMEVITLTNKIEQE